MSAYNEAFHKAYPEEYENADEDEDVNVWVEEKVFKQVEFSRIDEVLYVIFSGLACGPVSFSTYFGIKK